MKIKEFIQKLNQEQLSLLFSILKKCRNADNHSCFHSTNPIWVHMHSFSSQFLDLDINDRSDLFSESDPKYLDFTKKRGDITLLHCLFEFIYSYSNFRDGALYNGTLCEICLILLNHGANPHITSTEGSQALTNLINAYPENSSLQYWIDSRYIDVLTAISQDVTKSELTQPLLFSNIKEISEKENVERVKQKLKQITEGNPSDKIKKETLVLRKKNHCIIL